MECLVNLLAVCLFDPSGVYVSAHAHQVQAGERGSRWCKDHLCQGLMSEFKFGVRVDLTRRIELDYGIRHQSFPLEYDRGEESLFAGITWRPFGD